MNIYKILKLYSKINSSRLRAAGLLAMHLLHRRYTCLFFDPVLGCNLRCQMCYFSDAEKRKEMHGIFTDDDLNAIAKSLFPNIIKLQIGCGAEPTLYKKLDRVVALGRQYGVPYISMTTNGNLLTEEKLRTLVGNGLNEITISLHGVKEKTYEYFMQGADFNKFKELISILSCIKKDYPDFKIRVNYTVNEDNVEDLRDFASLFASLDIDILQIRPVQKIGESQYDNFSMTKILDNYESCILPLVDYCHKKGILCLYPSKENIKTLVDSVAENETDNTNSLVNMMPHFYLSPYPEWKQKINPYTETFYGYCRRTHRVGKLLWYVLSGKIRKEHDVTKSMNYNVK